MSSEYTSSGHPPLGTLIDENSLRLVEVLGTGGYGVVYRAVDAYSRNPRSYAVKCLTNTGDRSAARRHLHMREVTLHQLASSHPSVVTLHRVIREHNCMFIVMDYATDGDLFAQILTDMTYLGRDSLIKHVFLQIIDAVQHCHSLGIYHRDLKPENVLCFKGGYQVAITDFGLATTEKASREFRTGSVYHMSPECQSADSRSSKATYSPLHNDIWSLGIMLLNLTTGRNPWKSATLDDPTFQAYMRNPRNFLKNVLPISQDLNDILEGALAVDWRKRMSLLEMRASIECVRTFYSDSVVFDGNLATCPWEAGFDFEAARARSLPETPVEDDDPLYVVSATPATRRASEITVLEGLGEEDEEDEEDEPVEWDGVHSDYEPQGAVFWDSPVHSTYEYDGRSDSEESDLPVTPTSTCRECSGGRSVINWIAHTPVDEEYEDRAYDGREGLSFRSFEDDGSFVTSFVNPVQGDYKTRRRYSSPNTSVYSVAEEPTTAFVTNKSDFDSRNRTRPIDIPRTKSKLHGFNPMRFFPRSSGKSWLNPKAPHATDPRESQVPSTVRVTELETRPSWEGYYQRPYHSTQKSQTTDRTSRVATTRTAMHGNGHWLPHFFSSLAS